MSFRERIAISKVATLARIAAARAAGRLLREHRQTSLFPLPSDMKVTLGFTGSRRGMTVSQRKEVEEALEEVVSFVSKVSPLLPLMPVHGGCTGADAQFDEACRVRELGPKFYPGNLPKWRAELPEEDALALPAPPLARNVTIVKVSHLMIAAPATKRQARSGTWSTIRGAWRSDVPIVLVYPDGSGMFRDA